MQSSYMSGAVFTSRHLAKLVQCNGTVTDEGAPARGVMNPGSNVLRNSRACMLVVLGWTAM